MKVHITCTPEFPIDQLSKVIALLSETPGVMTFSNEGILSAAQFSLFDRRFNDNAEIPSLTKTEFIKLVGFYRTLKEIPDDEFVILISTIKHDKIWFSFFEGRNIYVHGAGWEYISDADPVYGITFQCVENIFQSLMELNIDDIDNEPNIHQESIGCINDFCREKEDILKKLRNADICDSCSERAIQMNVDPIIVVQIGDITEVIRKAFVNKRRFAEKIQLKTVFIDVQANIKIGDDIFNPTGILPKLIFIYFLKYPDGVETVNLINKKDHFLLLYRAIKRSEFEDDINVIKRLCGDEQDKKVKRAKSVKSTFKTYKSRLNSELEQLLGKELAKHYQIHSTKHGSRNFQYKINLNADYKNIDPRF